MRTDLWVNKERNGRTHLNLNIADDVNSTTVYDSRDKCATAVLIHRFIFTHENRPSDQCIRRAQVKVGLRLERRYSQR